MSENDVIPVARCRCDHFTTLATLTPNSASTSQKLRPLAAAVPAVQTGGSSAVSPSMPTSISASRSNQPTAHMRIPNRFNQSGKFLNLSPQLQRPSAEGPASGVPGKRCANGSRLASAQRPTQSNEIVVVAASSAVAIQPRLQTGWHRSSGTVDPHQYGGLKPTARLSASSCARRSIYRDRRTRRSMQSKIHPAIGAASPSTRQDGEDHWTPFSLLSWKWTASKRRLGESPFRSKPVDPIIDLSFDRDGAFRAERARPRKLSLAHALVNG